MSKKKVRFIRIQPCPSVSVPRPTALRCLNRYVTDKLLGWKNSSVYGSRIILNDEIKHVIVVFFYLCLILHEDLSKFQRKIQNSLRDN